MRWMLGLVALWAAVRWLSKAERDVLEKWNRAHTRTGSQACATRGRVLARTGSAHNA